MPNRPLIGAIAPTRLPGPSQQAMGAVIAPLIRRELFRGGEQGAWYDQTETSSLAQDAAGTTAAVMEQAVGLMRDKSGRGNNASQTTLAARPVLSARHNLLTFSEQFDNGAWQKQGQNNGSLPVVTQNAGTDPLGGNTADRVVIARASAATGDRSWLEQSGGTGTVSTSYTLSIWVKSNTGSNQTLSLYGNFGTGPRVYFTATTEWQRFTCTGSTTTAAALRYILGFFADTVSGLTADVLVWGADLRLTADVTGLPTYQRVAAATDYATEGFPQRVQYDRTDDSHTVAAGGGSTTAFFFCASIRINAIGQTQTIYSDTGTNTGYRIRINSSNQLEMAVGNGSAYTTVSTTDTFALGERAVITCWHDGTNIYAQKNRGAVASQVFATATAGTDGFTLGKDNDAASNFFGGGLYQYVHTKNAYKGDSARAKAQAFCAAKALVTL